MNPGRNFLEIISKIWLFSEDYITETCPRELLLLIDFIVILHYRLTSPICLRLFIWLIQITNQIRRLQHWQEPCINVNKHSKIVSAK
jgi:hypothetical protein